jgi:hypothetical protein
VSEKWQNVNINGKREKPAMQFEYVTSAVKVKQKKILQSLAICFTLNSFDVKVRHKSFKSIQPNELWLFRHDESKFFSVLLLFHSSYFVTGSLLCEFSVHFFPKFLILSHLTFICNWKSFTNHKIDKMFSFQMIFLCFIWINFVLLTTNISDKLLCINFIPYRFCLFVS